MTIRAIKTSLKSILIGSFFVLGLFFTVSASAQTSWFSDNFESYALESNLAGQGGWVGEVGVALIRGERPKTGQKSVLMMDTRIYISPEETEVGYLNGWFFANDHSLLSWEVYFNYFPAAIQFGFNTNRNYCNNNQIYLYKEGGGEVTVDCRVGEWNYFEFEWGIISGFLKFKYNFNSEGWSDWNTAMYQTTKKVNRFKMGNKEGYFDDIGIPVLELGEYERDIIISPTYPPDGEIIEEDYNFTATGNWEVPEDSLICYRKLSIYFEDIETGEINSFTKDIVGNPKTSNSYSISVTDLGDKNYYVWYRSSGYLYCIFLMGNIVYSTHEVENTIVRVGSYPELPIELEAQLFYPDSPFEDCSEYELLERLVCEIKNFGYSLIYPKPENTVLLKRNFEQIKKKAPLNYVSLIKNEFITMKEQMGTEKISFSIFENEAEIDFKIFEQEHEFKGQNFTLGNLILYSSSFILILLFAFYLINVIRRIF